MPPAPLAPEQAGIKIEVYRQYERKPYLPLTIGSMAVAGECILYASPDSMYAKTPELLHGATTSPDSASPPLFTSAAAPVPVIITPAGPCRT